MITVNAMFSRKVHGQIETHNVPHIQLNCSWNDPEICTLLQNYRPSGEGWLLGGYCLSSQKDFSQRAQEYRQDISGRVSDRKDPFNPPCVELPMSFKTAKTKEEFESCVANDRRFDAALKEFRGVMLTCLRKENSPQEWSHLPISNLLRQANLDMVGLSEAVRFGFPKKGVDEYCAHIANLLMMVSQNYKPSWEEDENEQKRGLTHNED